MEQGAKILKSIGSILMKKKEQAIQMQASVTAIKDSFADVQASCQKMKDSIG